MLPVDVKQHNNNNENNNSYNYYYSNLNKIMMSCRIQVFFGGFRRISVIRWISVFLLTVSVTLGVPIKAENIEQNRMACWNSVSGNHPIKQVYPGHCPTDNKIKVTF